MKSRAAVTCLLALLASLLGSCLGFAIDFSWGDISPDDRDARGWRVIQQGKEYSLEAEVVVVIDTAPGSIQVDWHIGKSAQYDSRYGGGMIHFQEFDEPGTYRVRVSQRFDVPCDLSPGTLIWFTAYAMDDCNPICTLYKEGSKTPRFGWEVAAPEAIAPSFRNDEGYILVNQTAGFTNTTQATGVSAWEWVVDGQVVSSARDLSATFEAEGPIEVRLRAQDGCSGTWFGSHKTFEVVSDVSPDGGIRPSYRRAGVNEVIDFRLHGVEDPDGGRIRSIEWDFGDGSGAASGERASHAYRAEGSYDVVVTICDDERTCTELEARVVVSMTDEERIDAAVDWSAQPYLLTFDEQPQIDHWCDGEARHVSEASHWGLPGSDLKGIKLAFGARTLAVRFETHSPLPGTPYNYSISFWNPNGANESIHIFVDPGAKRGWMGYSKPPSPWDDISGGMIRAIRVDLNAVSFLVEDFALPNGLRLMELRTWRAHAALEHPAPPREYFNFPGFVAYDEPPRRAETPATQPATPAESPAPAPIREVFPSAVGQVRIGQVVGDWSETPYILSYERHPQVTFWHDGQTRPLSSASHWGLPGSDVMGIRLWRSEENMAFRFETYSESQPSEYHYSIVFSSPDPMSGTVHAIVDPQTSNAWMGTLSPSGAWTDLGNSMVKGISIEPGSVSVLLADTQLPNGYQLADLSSWTVAGHFYYPSNPHEIFNLPGTVSQWASLASLELETAWEHMPAVLSWDADAEITYVDAGRVKPLELARYWGLPGHRVESAKVVVADTHFAVKVELFSDDRLGQYRYILGFTYNQADRFYVFLDPGGQAQLAFHEGPEWMWGDQLSGRYVEVAEGSICATIPLSSLPMVSLRTEVHLKPVDLHLDFSTDQARELFLLPGTGMPCYQESGESGPNLVCGLPKEVPQPVAGPPESVSAEPSEAEPLPTGADSPLEFGNTPQAIEIADGIAYVVDWASGLLQTVDLSTGSIRNLASGFSFVTDITSVDGCPLVVSEQGKAWIVAPETGEKTEVSLDGLPVGEILGVESINGTLTVLVHTAAGPAIAEIRGDETTHVRIDRGHVIEFIALQQWNGKLLTLDYLGGTVYELVLDGDAYSIAEFLDLDDVVPQEERADAGIRGMFFTDEVWYFTSVSFEGQQGRLHVVPSPEFDPLGVDLGAWTVTDFGRNPEGLATVQYGADERGEYISFRNDVGGGLSITLWNESGDVDLSDAAGFFLDAVSLGEETQVFIEFSNDNMSCGEGALFVNNEFAPWTLGEEGLLINRDSLTVLGPNPPNCPDEFAWDDVDWLMISFFPSDAEIRFYGVEMVRAVAEAEELGCSAA